MVADPRIDSILFDTDLGQVNLLMSDNPVYLFRYYSVETIKEISIKDCAVSQLQGGSYIDMYVEKSPIAKNIDADPSMKCPFIYINTDSIKEHDKIDQYAIVCHACLQMTHLLFMEDITNDIVNVTFKDIEDFFKALFIIICDQLHLDQ